jgi:photosystem II stability/assembly factor-like uncharacterized protein
MSRRIEVIALAVLALAARAAAQGAPAHTPRAEKGIWEPVNYTEDIDLGSVFFATPMLGWVAGDHGTIARTIDGGAHWTAQLGGDPKSAELALDGLRFIDYRHGWATERFPQTDSRLLRTVDGEHWEQVGAIPHVFSNTYSDYAFTSVLNGTALVGAKILTTRDGGKSWREAFSCAAKAEVDGLAREVECSLISLSFVSATVGYALGGTSQLKGKVFIARTTDGGNSWAVQIADGPEIYDNFQGIGGRIAFTDVQHGVICDYHGRLSATNDGGVTWHGIAGKGGSNSMLFADPSVAFSMDQNRVAYTADGGGRWLSRDFAFPGTAMAISAPRRDRAYVVGQHGMVYAYRVVHAGYTHPKMIAAPIVGPAPAAFENSMEQLGLQTASLDSVIASGAPAAPATPAAQAARAKRVSSLQIAFEAATGLLPDFLANYRNLNLVVLGLRTAGAMPGQAESAKSAFAAFKQAGDPQAAQMALAQLSAALHGLTQLADTALQTSPPPAN